MRKDLTTKRCLSDNERYADLLNGAVFGGRQLLKPQDLTDRDFQAIMKLEKASGKKKGHKSVYHDLIKKAAFGENWDGSRDLHGILDMRDIPEELRAYVNNYPIHVIEVRKLENTDVFKTDLKQIFDFIRFSTDRDKLLALTQSDPAYQEMDEAAYDMVSEYVNEEGLIEMKKYQGKGGKVNMCKALEDMRTESREEGREEGIGALIEAYQEFRVSKEETIIKLCDKFDLSRERAEECVRKYWK